VTVFGLDFSSHCEYDNHKNNHTVGTELGVELVGKIFASIFKQNAVSNGKADTNGIKETFLEINEIQKMLLMKFPSVVTTSRV
jgi:hypothetical protein